MQLKTLLSEISQALPEKAEVTQDWEEVGMVSYCLIATEFVWDDKKKFWKWWVNRYNTVPNAIKLYT